MESVFADARGRLWVGWADKGLSVLNEGRWQHVDARSGVPASLAQFLLVDAAGNLWAGTDAGLLRLAGDSLESWLRAESATIDFVLLDPTDGLPFALRDGYYPLVRTTAAGEIALATMRGVTMVDAKQDFRAAPVPSARFTAILRDTEPVLIPAAGAVVLPPGSRRVEIRFTAVNPRDGDSLGFEYSLDGGRTGWIDSARARRAEFFDLAPGRYQFAVRAVARDGRRGEAQMLPLELQPHYWQTLWFRAGSVVLLVGLVGGGVWAAQGARLRRERERLDNERRVAEAQARADHERR